MAIPAALLRLLAAGGTTGRVGALEGALLGKGVMSLADELIEQFGPEITVPVSSSAIRAIGYRPADETIIVEFHKRGTYTYAGSPQLFEEFLAAPSKGRFFNDVFQVRR